MILINKTFLQKALKNNHALFHTCDNIFAKNVSIDSRNLKKNSLFIAIKGNNFDGHDFINQAFKNHACAVIASKNLKNQKFNTVKNIIFVDNTLLALQEIAKNYLKTKNILKVAITGSNGKTTTKELIGYALRHALGEKNIFTSKGNLNNQIGVPLSVLSLNA